jgi:hypothetical protein
MSPSVSSRSSGASIHPTRQQLDELDALLKRMLELPVSSPDQDRASHVPAPATADDGTRAAVDDEESPHPVQRYPELPPQQPAEHDSIGPRIVPSEAPDDNPVEPTPEEAEEWVPLRSSWQPSPQTWGPLARQWQAQQEVRTKRTRPDVEATDLRSRSAEDDDESIRQDEDALRPLPTSWKADARAVMPPPAASPPTPVETSTSNVQPPLPVSLWPFAAIDTIFDVLLLLTGPLGRRLRTPEGKSVLAGIGVIAIVTAAALVTADLIGWTW